MELETPEELAEKIADWLGIYGGCKNVGIHDDKCEYTGPERPFCCRNAFVPDLTDRIIQSVNNLKIINNAEPKIEEPVKKDSFAKTFFKLLFFIFWFCFIIYMLVMYLRWMK